MSAVYRVALAAMLAAMPVCGVFAQTVVPGTAGSNGASTLSTPTYPRGTSTNPATMPGTDPGVLANVPPKENPNVPGATGNAIVPGNNSTIASDRSATASDKTGTVQSGSDSSGSGGR